MFLDKLTLFSEDQAVTATAASTNYIDFGGDFDVGKGEPLELIVIVTEAFDNLTNLAIAVQTDDNTSFSSATTLHTETIVLANLTAGAELSIRFWPRANERYGRLNYTVTGTTPTAGKITAGIGINRQDTDVYPNAID